MKHQKTGVASYLAVAVGVAVISTNSCSLFKKKKCLSKVLK